VATPPRRRVGGSGGVGRAARALGKLGAATYLRLEGMELGDAEVIELASEALTLTLTSTLTLTLTVELTLTRTLASTPTPTLTRTFNLRRRVPGPPGGLRGCISGGTRWATPGPRHSPRRSRCGLVRFRLGFGLGLG